MEPLNGTEDHQVTGQSQPKTTTAKARCVKFARSNLLLLLMLFAALIGVIMGLSLNSIEPKFTQPQLVYLRFPGDLFIQSMKMLLIPIVVSSLLCSTAEIDIRSSGKIGLRALAYYVSTLVLASLLGITLALTIRPGERTSVRPQLQTDSRTSSSGPGLAFMDLFRNMVPDNLMEVTFRSKKTSRVTLTLKPQSNESTASMTWNSIVNFSEPKFQREDEHLVVNKVDGMNMMGLVVCSILFGCVTSAVGNEAKPILDFFKAVRVVGFKLVAIFVWYSPVGIAFLIAAKLAEMDDPAKTFKDLGIFALTVLAGLAIHGFVVLSLLYLLFVRKNPLKLLADMIPALVFAFGCESSSATLPVTIKCLEEKAGIDPRVTKLTASVGSTVNMDGACLYFSLMVIYVAQLNGIPLSAGQLATISILSLSIAMGAAGIPGTGVIYMIMILDSMGLPKDAIGALLTIDWFLIRCRTSINVLGDGFGAGIIEKLSRKELRKMALMESPNGSTKPPQDREFDIVVSNL